jgi:uncharacterized RDD family membrane protein YckC
VTAAPPTETLFGHYAGAVTRLAAYAIDATLAVTLYGLVLSLTAFIWQLIGRGNLELPARDSIWWLVGLGAWTFTYFAASWALASKTPGMGVLGLRVVRRDGAPLNPARGIVRALAFPLSFLLAGLGFIGIVIGRERRALHDVIADTTVVYDWDARAARWRSLSRSPA